MEAEMAQSHKSFKPGRASVGVVPSVESPQHGWLGILVSKLGLRELRDCRILSLACTSIHKECTAQGIWQLKFQPWRVESKLLPAPEPQPGPSKNATSR